MRPPLFVFHGPRNLQAVMMPLPMDAEPEWLNT